MHITRECDSNTCPAPGGFLSSQPELAGNAFMLAAFAALIPLNVYTGIRYRTPLYASLITMGLVLEALSHIGKILLHSNMAHPIYFSLHMVTNLWGPTIIGAAIYTVLPHLMAIYGPEVHIMSRPVYLNIFFAVMVIFAMAFQSVGMVFASNGSTVAVMAQAMNIALAGLAIQLASLVIFVALYYYIRYRDSHRRYILDPKLAVVCLSSKFRITLFAIQLAVFLVAVRTALRAAALSTGLSGALFQSEPTSFVLDDATVLLAVIILSSSPPGRAFGSSWKDTTPYTLSVSCPGLPLQSRKHAGVRTRVISQPFPLTSTFTPGTPRDYDSIRTPAAPQFTSPSAVRPVYKRPAYEISPPAKVPFMGSEVASANRGMSPSRKNNMWGVSAQSTPELVNPDGIW